jgi:hypothetical protein
MKCFDIKFSDLKFARSQSAGIVLMSTLLAACGGGGGDEAGLSNTPAVVGWSAPVTLSSLDSDADGPRLGADASGNVAVLWSQYDDTQGAPVYRVWMNYWRTGKGWLGSNGIDSGNRRNPVFTMGADGSNRAVWPTAVGDQLLYTEFQANEGNSGPGSYDTSWNHPRSTFVSGSGLGNPQVITYGSNQTLVVYTVNGSPTVVKASVGGGGGVSSSSTVQLSGATAASMPQLLRLPNDNALAVWCENGLLTSRRFDGTGWAAAAQASDCVDVNLRLVVSADGTKVVAAGQKNYKGELHVWRYDTGTNAWSDTAESVLPYPHDTTYPPALAIDNAGRVLLVWVDYDSDTGRRSLWASVGTRSSAVGVLTSMDNWSAPLRIDDTTTGKVASPQVAIDGNGNVYAVWTQYSSHWDVLARRFNSSTFTLGGIEALESDTGEAYKPQILFDSNNKAVVAWGYVSGISGDSHSGIRAVHHQ